MPWFQVIQESFTRRFEKRKLQIIFDPDPTKNQKAGSDEYPKLSPPVVSSMIRIILFSKYSISETCKNAR